MQFYFGKSQHFTEKLLNKIDPQKQLINYSKL